MTTLEVTINGKTVTPITRESACIHIGQTHDETVLSLGYNPSEGTPNVISFTGSIKEVNIFSGNLPDRDKEYRYMRLLKVSAPYPECTCQAGQAINITGSVEMCNDGRSRFTGADIGGKYFYHISSLNDGIKDSDQPYGYIKTRPTNELIITPTKPSVVKQLTVIASISSVGIYKDVSMNRNKHEWHLLSCNLGLNNGSNIPNGCYNKMRLKGSWRRNVTMKSLIWRLEDSVITNALSVVFFEENNEVSQASIYEVELRGRTLDEDNKRDTRCFPLNSKSETGGRCPCKCRNGNKRLAGPECKPYISGIEPESGPLSGGTKLTIYGGLLDPSPDPSYTSVNISGFHLCEDSVSRVPFHISVLGENFNTYFTGHPNYTLQIWTNEHTKKLMYCNVWNSTIMECRGTIEQDQSLVEVYISCSFTGCEKYRDASTITMYRAPNVTSCSIIDQSNKQGTLMCKGEYLNSGCRKDNYMVMLGQEECEIKYLDFHKLNCTLLLNSLMVGKLLVVVKVYNFEYVTTLHFDGDNSLKSPLSPIIGASVTALVFLAGSVLSARFAIRRIRKFRERRIDTDLMALNLRESTEEHPVGPSLENAASLEKLLNSDLKKILQEFIIDRSKLQIEEEIGKGNFGKVHRGVVEKDGAVVEVALKMLKDHIKTDCKLATELLYEATIMWNFKHPNVVPLLGVVLDDQDCYVILPFMDNGDLRTHVMAHDFNLEKNIHLILDVAKGMAYLTQQKFIHRDLAARNCMVDGSEKVLIGDFGLARDIYENDYYRPEDKKRPLPVKWMALESILKGIFTNKSDVWAFAILMWEVFSQGAKPYADVPNHEMRHYLKRGYRLEQPDNCPDKMYNLMTDCWKKDPLSRPLFPSIVTFLHSMLTLISAADDGSHDYSTEGHYSSGDSSITSISSESRVDGDDPIIPEPRPGTSRDVIYTPTVTPTLLLRASQGQQGNDSVTFSLPRENKLSLQTNAGKEQKRKYSGSKTPLTLPVIQDRRNSEEPSDDYLQPKTSVKIKDGDTV